MSASTPKPKVLVTSRLPSVALEPLRQACDVDYRDEAGPIPRDVFLERVRPVDGLVCQLSDKIDVELINAARSLRVVADVSVGYNNVDVEAAKQRGIIVTHTPDVLTDATADLTLGLILGITRRLVEGDRLIRRGGWKSGFGLDFMLGTDLKSKRLGIIGMGRIGQAVARRAASFGMEIAYTPSARQSQARVGGSVSSSGGSGGSAAAGASASASTGASGAQKTQLSELRSSPEARSSCRPDFVGANKFDGFVATPLILDELLSSSDIVSLHVPLTNETRHLIDQKRLVRMKRSSYLINVARGPVVDEAALAWALREGVISGAGLDVFEEEPKVHPDLMTLENVMLVPHLGSATRETRTKMAELAVNNCLNVVTGKPPLTPIPEMKLESTRG
jgi:glyoxylate reductase